MTSNSATSAFHEYADNVSMKFVHNPNFCADRHGNVESRKENNKRMRTRNNFYPLVKSQKPTRKVVSPLENIE